MDKFTDKIIECKLEDACEGSDQEEMEFSGKCAKHYYGNLCQ